MPGARVQAVARRLPQPGRAAVVRETYAAFAVGIAGLAQPVSAERDDAGERGLGLRSQVSGLRLQIFSRGVTYHSGSFQLVKSGRAFPGHPDGRAVLTESTKKAWVVSLTTM